MTEFDKTNWTKPDFSEQFIEKADVIVVERRRMLEILKSFFRRHRKETGGNTVLDLGCGDGILTHELLTVDPTLSATLVDGSADMLEKARKRLAGFRNIDYVQASFQQMVKSNVPGREFDFAISSLAIHHLSQAEKKELFGYIYSVLTNSGHFLNIDVVLAPASALEDFYMRLWQEWIDNRMVFLRVADESLSAYTRKYKENADNKPDTLDYQLGVLKDVGFRDVDCYYKYGIFTIFGGRKI
ncbi:MAG: methyltransferase domain-containing protein [Nitrospiraceae bacterium]|nr:methyltransferase domain-containing protein [Nitrospiraceae bacterium]